MWTVIKYFGLKNTLIDNIFYISRLETRFAVLIVLRFVSGGLTFKSFPIYSSHSLTVLHAKSCGLGEFRYILNRQQLNPHNVGRLIM